MFPGTARNNPIQKLGLGTVQFGQAYGVSNPRGQVPPQEVAIILARARQAGVTLLDTSPNYGTAEAALAKAGVSDFRIVTKTLGLQHGLDVVIAGARQSARMLGADTLLVHAAQDLAGPMGEIFWQALLALRDEGVFRKIGISAYLSDNPMALAARFAPDVMQLPVSLLDQRLLAGGTLARLADKGIELHARSIFLQGLLFLERLPGKLRRAAPCLENLRARITEAGATPLQAALGFVLARPEIRFALAGITSLTALNQIITACEYPLPELDWSSLALDDELVLTPTLW